MTNKPDIINLLFRQKTIGGIIGFYFKDSSISKHRFGLTTDVYYDEGDEDVYHFAYHSIDEDGEFHLGENTQVFDINITIDKVKGDVYGEVIMMSDYNLSDAGCMVFYDLGLDVCYNSDEIYDEDYLAVRNVYYDKTVITRRHSIKEIIEHQ